MTGLDAAIRNALERADRTNPQVRARIYQSARRALESGLQKQGIDDPVTIASQRGRLERAIAAIEQEEQSRPLPQPEEEFDIASVHRQPEPEPEPESEPDHAYPEPDVSSDAPAAHGSGWFDEPGRASDSEPPPVMQDPSALGAAEGRLTRDRRSIEASLDLAPAASAKPRRRRGVFSRIFIFSVVVAFIGIGLWWALETGLLSLQNAEDFLRSPTPQVSEEDFDGTDKPQSVGIQTGFSSEWIELFTPQNISVLNARQNATMDPIQTSTGSAIEMTSTSADDDGSVTVTIPPAILRTIAGKRSTIALTFQSSSDSNVQIAVQCDFSTLGGCGRHRFTVSQEKTDTLFQIEFARSLAPNSPGRLIINPDLAGKGKGIILYAVRLLPGR